MTNECIEDEEQMTDECPRQGAKPTNGLKSRWK